MALVSIKRTHVGIDVTRDYLDCTYRHEFVVSDSVGGAGTEDQFLSDCVFADGDRDCFDRWFAVDIEIGMDCFDAWLCAATDCNY